MFFPLFFKPSARFVTKRKGQSKSTAEMNGAVPTLPNIKESPDGETQHSPRGLPRAESNPTL
jgi:hypothetical protein